MRIEKTNSARVIHISSKQNRGIGALKNRVMRELGVNNISTEMTYLSTNRQYLAIKECSAALDRANSFIALSPFDCELFSFEIRASLDAVDSILGNTSPDDILNHVFATMCVGK